MALRRQFCLSSAYAVTLGDLALFFTDGNLGMLCVVEALIDIVQSLPKHVLIFVGDLVPCENTVCDILYK